MIKTLSSPGKVSWIYPLIKDFCKRGNVNYNARDLAQWLRIWIVSPLIKVIVSKNEENSYDGFAVMVITTDLLVPVVYVQNFIANTKEAKEEMAKYIVDFAKEQGIFRLEYHTSHDPEWMKERFDMVPEASGFRQVATVMQLELEEDDG